LSFAPGRSAAIPRVPNSPVEVLSNLIIIPPAVSLNSLYFSTDQKEGLNETDAESITRSNQTFANSFVAGWSWSGLGGSGCGTDLQHPPQLHCRGFGNQQ
jgi:hypothetical protein